MKYLKIAIEKVSAGLKTAEGILLSTVLGAMVIISLVEVSLRKTEWGGFPEATTIVQHLSLLVGVLGGALAARELRLLSISTVTTFLKGKWKTAANLFSQSIGAVIAFFLTLNSIIFILAEKKGGQIWAWGIPTWAVQCILPIGFSLITLRLIWGSSESWRGRLVSLLIATVFSLVAYYLDIPMGWYTGLALTILLLGAFLGTPIFAIIGGVTMVMLWVEYLQPAAIPIKYYSLATNPSLPAIPMFTLAGYFLAEGGASKRLVRVFQTLLGQFRGGPAIVTALVCAIFTAFTGASGVTILALGGLLLPVLIKSRFSENNALGLLTSAGSLGTIFPPCITLILYAVTANNILANLGIMDASITTNISLEAIFLAGILPGGLLVMMTAGLGIWQGRALTETEETFSWKEALAAIMEAKWELLLPAVALISLFGGFATPIEAAAITAFYAFVVETFIYRDLSIKRDLVRVMSECGLLVGGVLLILGVAMGFSYYLVYQSVPDLVVEWFTESIHSRWLFLLLLNIFLLIVGCLMDIFSAIVVVAPLVIPLGIEFGVDPIHLGIIFLANLELGYMTPPVGMNLFLSSYRFNKSMPKIIKSVMPMFSVRFIGVLIITYVPVLTLWLPGFLD